MRLSRTLLLGGLVPAVILLNSCSKREDLVLAQFADRKITIGDFERSYARVDVQFLPKATGIEGRREFLTTMLNKEVMAHQADMLGYEKDPNVLQGMEAFTKMGLQAAYIQREVGDKLAVTDEEVKFHYKNTGVTLGVKEIVCDTPQEIELAYQSLEDGIDFETVCRRFSKSPDAAEGGTIVTITYGMFMPLLQEQAFRLGVGEYTEPTYTPAGFVILKVVQRNEARSKAPFDEVRDQMEEEYRGIKETLMSNAMTDRLRDEYGVTWYWDNVKLCFDALPPDRNIQDAPRREDEVYPLLYFEQEDLDKPVVTYTDKTIRVKDFSDYYDQASFYARPRRNVRTAGVRTFLTERIMSDIIDMHLERSGIANDPEVVEVMTRKQEELMIGRLYEDMIKRQVVVTSGMVNEYYEENREDFRVPEKRRFGVILTPDLETASAAYQALQNGELFRNVMMAYSIDAESKKKLGETETLARGEQPEIDDVGFALPEVGSYSEPFQTSRGWMILRLQERFPEKSFTLTEARDTIHKVLEQREADKKLKQLLNEWKDELDITINEANLSKIQVEERSPTEATEPVAAHRG